MNLSYTIPSAEHNILSGVKIHTLRDDKHGLWKPGKLIHHCTGLRSKQYNCFLKNTCISTQKVLIVMAKEKTPQGAAWRMHITIDRKRLSFEEMQELIKNDGLPTYNAFRDFLFPSFAKGRPRKTMRVLTLIHWTDKKY